MCKQRCSARVLWRTSDLGGRLDRRHCTQPTQRANSNFPCRASDKLLVWGFACTQGELVLNNSYLFLKSVDISGKYTLESAFSCANCKNICLCQRWSWYWKVLSLAMHLEHSKRTLVIYQATYAQEHEKTYVSFSRAHFRHVSASCAFGRYLRRTFSCKIGI